MALQVLRREAAPALRVIPAHSTAGLGQARVLVVDNDPAALAATAAVLTRWGLTVTTAAGLAEARGAIYGLTRATGRSELARAAHLSLNKLAGARP